MIDVEAVLRFFGDKADLPADGLPELWNELAHKGVLHAHGLVVIGGASPLRNVLQREIVFDHYRDLVRRGMAQGTAGKQKEKSDVAHIR